MGSLQFDQINVVVPDVAGAARFLRSLGADVDEPETDWAEWASHHVGFPTNSGGFAADIDSSAFAAFWGGLPDDYVGVVLNLRAEDRAAVDASFDLAVELGATCLRAPHDAFWGARYAVVRAPGPIVVGLMGPVDPERRVAGPAVSDFT
jgi:catechol 2,3-dioxygenase-like lactoylglutathione lyase family enzyme